MSESTPPEPLPYSEEQAAEILGRTWRETLLAAYRWMALGRAFDARMQGLQRQGRIGFYGAATGQEAVNVAAGLISRPEDWVFPGLREQLVSVVRGFPLAEYAHSIFGDARDPALGRQMPCHPTARGVHYVSMSSVIGTQVSHAVGLAYGIRQHHDPGVALAFFGDGATSSNDFHSGLNFAAVLRLPVVFVCANNQWAISVPVEHQTAAATLAHKAAAYGIPGRRLDGSDFFAAYRELASAIEDARSGKGPTMLECVTFRMTPHSSSDDPTRYQPGDWAIRAARHDPVARLERWLTDHGLLSAELRSRIQSEAEESARTAARQAEETPPPGPETVTEGVFASVPSRGTSGTGP
jgi:pyruvate dehydrogenase E1 component alpha subunit